MSTVKPNIDEFGEPVYAVSTDSDANIRISAVLNEAEHVFDWHADGRWKSEYKDGFARLLLPDLQTHPRLVGSILDLNNRIFSMVVHRAVELIKELPHAWTLVMLTASAQPGCLSFGSLLTSQQYQSATRHRLAGCLSCGSQLITLVDWKAANRLA
jgi:hypothetical protein